jgi:dUTPase
MITNEPLFKFAIREDLINSGISFLPERGEPNSTGWDVKCAEPEGITLQKNDYFKIRLGIRVLIPEGWWLELRPRSSTFVKRHMNCLNGVIDQDYFYELVLAGQFISNRNSLGDDVRADGSTKLRIEFGDRIGQVIPVKREMMAVSVITNEDFDNLSTARGAIRDGGIGSTGVK